MGFTLSRNARRATLVLHVLAGAGWMGLDIGLAVMVLTGATTDDGSLAAAVYLVARLVVPVAVPVLASTMLLTGIVLGLGTRYGLVQWWWVLVKLSLGTLLTVLVFVALVPGVLTIPTDLAGTADQVRDAVGRQVQDIIFPPLVSFSLLGVALVLSVWKPWGRTRWGRRRLGARAAD